MAKNQRTNKPVKGNTMPEKSNLPARMPELAIARMDVKAVSRAMSALGDGGMTPFDLERISFPTSGSLTANVPTEDGIEPRSALDAIILHHHAGRQRYESEFSGGTPQPPLCASYNGLTGYGDPGGACQACKFFEFGSSCHPNRYLYLLFPTDTFPTLFVLPRTSLRRDRRDRQMFHGYSLGLARRGKELWEVYSRIRFKPRPQGQGTIAFFEHGHDLSDADRAYVESYRESFLATLTFPVIAPARGVAADPTMPDDYDDDEDDI